MTDRERPTVDRALALRLAALARIELDEAEIEPMVRDLSRILAYVEVLGEAETEGVPPMPSVAADRVSCRADEPAPSLPAEVALREAPRAAGGGFAVPKFVDEG